MNTDEIAERLLAKIDDLERVLNQQTYLGNDVRPLLEEREAMKAALRFYADAKNYAGDFPAIFDDEGILARKALEGKP